jgi:uncharacterized protein (DUF2141 family)
MRTAMIQRRFPALVAAVSLATALVAWIAPACADQLEYAPAAMGACGTDIRTYCMNVKNGGGRILRCLGEHEKEISPGCRAASVVPPSDYPAPNEGLSLSVAIHNVRSDSGFIFVTLGDDAKAWPRGRRMIVLPAGKGTVTVIFHHLKPGAYAVMAYHDENDNGRLDMGPNGLPEEGMAYSNDVVGAPSFERSTTKLTANATISMSMNYVQQGAR